MPEIVSTPEPRENMVTLGGSFECHTCGDYVYEANYIIGKDILTWVCEKGHVTKIEYRYG